DRAALPDQEPAAGSAPQESARSDLGLPRRGGVGQPRGAIGGAIERSDQAKSTSAMSLTRVVVKPRRARPFFARHPWVFVTWIARVEGEPAPGDGVEVFSHERQFIARGLYNPHSAIRVRLYRWENEPLDEAYWSVLLGGAVRLRHEVLGLGRGGPG